MSRLLPLAAAAALAATPARAADAPAAPISVFAVIIGSNESADPQLPRLRFADDDAAKFFELFDHLGQARLLTVLDDDSQALFGHLAPQTRVPSLDNLDRALAELFAEVEAARARGERTAFYFIYSGHGHLRANMEGTFVLGQDRFTRSDLYRRVLARSPADHNHLIIDACNAYYMVSRRGDYPDDEAPVDFAPFVEAFLATADVSAFPNTGVVLSTSSEAATHEWSLFRAGVLSHEVRSGMLGAADVDGDGAIDYGELGAYLAAANARLVDPRSKLQVYAEPPRNDRSAPLLRYRPDEPSGAALLRVEPEVTGRLFLEDGRGLRYADLNKAGDRGLEILLLPGQPYHLRGLDFEVSVPAQARGAIALASLPPSAPAQTLQQRGAVEDDFLRNLYAIPFTRNFYQGHIEQAAKLRQVMGSLARNSAAAGRAPAPPPEPAPARAQEPGWPVVAVVMPIAGGGLTLAGLATLAAGGYWVKLAHDHYALFESAPTLENKRELQTEVNSERSVAAALLISGGVASALGLAATGIGLAIGLGSQGEPDDAP